MRVVDDLRLRARALRVQGMTYRGIAALLDVSRSHVHRLLLWEPPRPRDAEMQAPERVHRPEKIARRVAELHAKLHGSPHAMDRLTCLLLGERPQVADRRQLPDPTVSRWTRGATSRRVRRHVEVEA